MRNDYCFQAVPFLTSCLSRDSCSSDVTVACDVISICSHLVRTSSENSALVAEIFQEFKRKLDDIDSVYFINA